MLSLKAGALVTSAVLISFAGLIVPVGQAQGTPTAWSVVLSPNNGDGENLAYDTFNSVSCPAANECFAVGMNGIDPEIGSLIEEWDGSNWNPVASQTPRNSSALPSSVLNGVDCPSTNFCMAVGDYTTKKGVHTLVETWHGKNWKVQSSPNVDSFSNTLTAVSCTSSDYCVAVGDWPNGDTKNDRSELFAELWNGNSWSITANPINPGNASNTFDSVSCTETRICRAVGTYARNPQPGWYKTLVETWSGDRWTLSTSPNPGESNTLDSVSCLSATECVAVGYRFSSTKETTNSFVVTWNGTSWSPVHSPNQEIDGTNYGNFLEGVSCTKKKSCVAVGHYWNEDDTSLTLVESWNGSAWSIVTSPDVASQDNYSNFLVGVSCTATTSCIAVGSISNEDGDQTLVESWDGTSWSIGTSPNPGVDNSLSSVSCVTSTDCVAVGSFNSLTPESDLIETWDGTAWSIAPTPSFEFGSGPTLEGVSCSSSTSCMAVGSDSNSGHSQTLVESWNGTNWSVVSSPSPGTSSNVLNAVSCTSSIDCVAVGTYASSGSLQTLVEAWDGTSWSVASSPNVGSGDNALLGVSCVGSSDYCATVGYAYNSSNVGEPLIETWNGADWSIASSPNPNGDFNPLTAVSCADANDCVAVGRYYEAGTEYQTLAEVWNGSDWSITPTTDEAGYNALDGVSCDSPTDCVAVGQYDQNGNGNSQTEIEDWNGSIWSAAVSPSEQSSFLDGVSCVDSADCVAVGVYEVGAYTSYPFDSPSRDTLVEVGSDS